MPASNGQNSSPSAPPDFAPASAARLAAIPPAARRFHLLGVGGTAMAALAGMLQEQGYTVSGSDTEVYEPTRSLLRRMRIEVKSGFSPANLEPAPDLVVVGNVIMRSNPEAQALLHSSIPYLSMPEALWHFFLRQRIPLMVCGTHGKTTSTALMAQVLMAAGRDPAVLIGGVSRNLGSNYHLGAGPHFVIEGDEYDTAFFDKRPKFIHYRPRGAILTSLEFDHADIYRDLAHVKSAFAALLAELEPSSTVAVCADYPGALEVSAELRARRLTYGLAAGEFQAVEIAANYRGTHFNVARSGQTVARDLIVPIWGRMNVANALGVYVLLREFGLSEDEVAQGLRSFQGVARRQELIGEAAGVIILDDFAHHPTAIAATLQAVAERYAGRRLIAAFEPRSNTSRRNVFQADFARAFDGAAQVYLGPVYFKENDPIPAAERLAIDAVAAEITRRGPRAFAAASLNQLLEELERALRPGDVVLFMSNGPFGNLKHRLLEDLRRSGE